MSWGYFADLRLQLPTEAWHELRERSPSDVVMSAGWSGLDDRGLEARFASVSANVAAFAAALDTPAYHGPEVIRSIVERDATTELRICLLLDKSLLELAAPLATLLHAAREHAGAGKLRLVNDGNYFGEAGVELRLESGRVTTAKLADSDALAQELGEELLSGSAGGMSDEPPSATTKSVGRNPLTGKPIYVSTPKRKRSRSR